jgi:hypothetical protein
MKPLRPYTPLFSSLLGAPLPKLTYVATHVDTKINLMQVSAQKKDPSEAPQQMECAEKVMTPESESRSDQGTSHDHLRARFRSILSHASVMQHDQGAPLSCKGT